MGLDFLKGCRPQLPLALRHFVPDVAPLEGNDVGVVEGVLHVGVGYAVLHRAQVYVRERRLGRRR